MISALFVQGGGVYFERDSVDPWDEERDAMLYAGPYPVVAHPPCQLWTNFAALNYKRYGGEHNRPGNDGGMFAYALGCVRRFGGVLEHPAGSKAFAAHGLPKPRHGFWHPTLCGGWVTGVHQAAYGHKAQKRTWLYYVGPRPPDLDWAPTKGTHQCGWFDRIKPTLSKREASATPAAFADLLISLAEASCGARR